MLGSYTCPYYTDDLTDCLKLSKLYHYGRGYGWYQSQTTLIRSAVILTKKVGWKQKIDAGGSEKPEIQLPWLSEAFCIAKTLYLFSVFLVLYMYLFDVRSFVLSLHIKDRVVCIVKIAKTFSMMIG